ncbi:MAG: hypothetical protein HRU20_09600 [Pseudomonadales bacterium]|nr:hypothetical protein [Pseudomonadales bacterium]
MAEQYRSRELTAPSQPSGHNQKTIAELEQELSQLKDAYSRASTARFLARFYLQQGKNADLAKAIKYYQQSLKDKPGEEGLSRFAKQETVVELANIYFYKKNYAAFLQSLDQLMTYGGKLDQAMALKQAVAFYHQGKKQQALKTAKSIFKNLKKTKQAKVDTAILDQLLFIFFHLQDYWRAADVQQQLLALDNNNMVLWRRLSQIYIKAGKNDRAAETLLMAYQKKLKLTSQDMILLCDLLALSNNPYAAARQLQDFMHAGLLPLSVKRYEKLFNFWFKANETDKAIAALSKAAELEPEVERFLNLAELHRQQSQWQAMQDNVKKACAKELPDEYVSRANLYLGISELKLSNKASARQAFINATLLGGMGDSAANYLHFMQAPKPTEKELSSFYGPCKPAWASGDSRELNLAGVAGFAVQGKQDKSSLVSISLPDFEVKSVAPQRFFLGQFKMPVADMEKKLLPLAMKLGVHTIKNGGKIVGPMHFIFPEPVVEGATDIQFQMAFPVSKAPQMKGRYKLIDEPEYYCASLIYQGAPEGIVEAWKGLYFSVINKGYQPTGSSRQLVLDVKNASRENIKLELQMQLEKSVEK